MGHDANDTDHNGRTDSADLAWDAMALGGVDAAQFAQLPVGESDLGFDVATQAELDAASTGGTTETAPVAQPGEVQTTLDSVAEGQTVQLDPSSDYSTSGDFPWIFQNKTLDGAGATFDAPDGVRAVISFLPLTSGKIQDMTIDVAPTFTGDFVVGSDLPTDFPHVSGGRADDLAESVKRYGVPVMYSNRTVAENININGPDLQYFRYNTTEQPPNCAGLYIHEQGSGFGVQEWEVSTRGLDRGIHILAEGDTDSTNDTYGGGFINSNWFRGSHTFCRNHIRLECTGGSGINRNRFEVRLQPDDHMSEHFIHATCAGTGAGSPTIEENAFMGEFWDPTKFAENTHHAIRWDGAAVTNNIIRHSNDLENYILDENDQPLESAIAEQNGASGNVTVKEKTLGKLYEVASGTGLKFGHKLNSPNPINLPDVEPNQIFWSANAYNQSLEARYNQDDSNGFNQPRVARLNHEVRQMTADGTGITTDGSGANEVIRVDTSSAADTITIVAGDEIRNSSKTIFCTGANDLTVTSAGGNNILGQSSVALTDGEALTVYYLVNPNEWRGHRSGGSSSGGGGALSDADADGVYSLPNTSDTIQINGWTVRVSETEPTDTGSVLWFNP